MEYRHKHDGYLPYKDCVTAAVVEDVSSLSAQQLEQRIVETEAEIETLKESLSSKQYLNYALLFGMCVSVGIAAYDKWRRFRK